MTIAREVREKVIQLSEKGRGRNEIARLLNGQNLHISEGSVGNIIWAYREQSLDSNASMNKQPLQSYTNINDTNSPPSDRLDPQPKAGGVSIADPPYGRCRLSSPFRDRKSCHHY